MQSRRLRVAVYAAVLVIIAAVFSSLSRGGLIALGAVLLCVIVLPSRTFFRSTGQKLMVLLVLAVGGRRRVPADLQALTQRVNAVFTSEGRTGSGRLNAWHAAFTSIGERPFEGLGYGGFRPSANELMLRTPGVDLSNFRLRPQGLDAHSAYIETLAELGIPGLALFLGLIASTAIALRRAAASGRRLGEASGARLQCPFAQPRGLDGGSIFLSSETSRPLWILIGIALALPRLVAAEVEESAEQTRRAP